MSTLTPIPQPQTDGDPLISYPCRFPIKVMGERSDGFVPEMLAVARRFDPALATDSVEIRRSSGGKYLGLTLHVWVSSRRQLDELYRALSGHPMVKVTL